MNKIEEETLDLDLKKIISEEEMVPLALITLTISIMEMLVSIEMDR